MSTRWKCYQGCGCYMTIQYADTNHKNSVLLVSDSLYIILLGSFTLEQYIELPSSCTTISQSHFSVRTLHQSEISDEARPKPSIFINDPNQSTTQLMWAQVLSLFQLVMQFLLISVHPFPTAHMSWANVDCFSVFLMSYLKVSLLPAVVSLTTLSGLRHLFRPS